MFAIKNTPIREANVLPALRIHAMVKKISASPEHYVRLTRAAWNTVVNTPLGIRQLAELREDDNRPLLTVIRETQDALGTALTKGQDVMLFASPETSLLIMQLGYDMVHPSSPMPRNVDAVGFLNSQPINRKDALTGWRPFVSILKTLADEVYTVSEIPRWARCRVCTKKCNNHECPFELTKATV